MYYNSNFKKQNNIMIIIKMNDNKFNFIAFDIAKKKIAKDFMLLCNMGEKNFHFSFS